MQKFKCRACGEIQEAVHPKPCPKCGHQFFETLAAEDPMPSQKRKGE